MCDRLYYAAHVHMLHMFTCCTCTHVLLKFIYREKKLIIPQKLLQHICCIDVTVRGADFLLWHWRVKAQMFLVGMGAHLKGAGAHIFCRHEGPCKGNQGSYFLVGMRAHLRGARAHIFCKHEGSSKGSQGPYFL